uniref:Baculoviral IAP repeat-containing protein 5 n=1 Tax=Caligus rogercresseyi TaxID=217165 RepID=C1BPV4_CALRO|nr:Baculoviral IAP repeat-containing protein 5 [Caligus rogercresseyi]
MDSVFKNAYWSYEERLKSFGKTWPFKEESSPCSPAEMAASGFYFVGNRKEPDLVRCFYCLRELDGWEPSDIPQEEHARKKCSFMELSKGHAEVTVLDGLQLEAERRIAILESEYQMQKEAFLQLAEEARTEMMGLIEKTAQKRKSRSRKKRT